MDIKGFFNNIFVVATVGIFLLTAFNFLHSNEWAYIGGYMTLSFIIGYWEMSISDWEDFQNNKLKIRLKRLYVIALGSFVVLASLIWLDSFWTDIVAMNLNVIIVRIWRLRSFRKYAL